MKNSKPVISERRQRVWTCLTRGMSRQEIATELKVNTSTVGRDVHYLAVESKNYLNNLAKETLPFYYEICLEGIRNVIKQAYVVHDSKDDNKVKTSDKLAALRLIMDAHESVFHLLDEGPSIMYLKQLQEKLLTLEGR